MPTVLPLPERAPRANTPKWLKAAATKTLDLAGWKMAGEWPDLSKMVIIGAPHSSAWDAIWGLLAKVAMDLHIFYMGKQEAFVWPLGPLMKWLGGIPVNRAAPGGIADQVEKSFLRPNLERQFAFMEAELKERDWFAGSDFSAADVQMSFPLEAASARGGLNQRFPRLKDWLARIHARPAYQRALTRGGPYKILD